MRLEIALLWSGRGHTQSPEEALVASLAGAVSRTVEEGPGMAVSAQAGGRHPGNQDINAEDDDSEDEQLRKFFSFKMLQRGCSNPSSRSIFQFVDRALNFPVP